MVLHTSFNMVAMIEGAPRLYCYIGKREIGLKIRVVEAVFTSPIFFSVGATLQCWHRFDHGPHFAGHIRRYFTRTITIFVHSDLHFTRVGAFC